MSSEERKDADTADQDNNQQPKNDDAAALQFHPITLSSDTEEDATSSDDDDDEETPATAPKSKKSFAARVPKTTTKIPLKEDAIQECFLLAVQSHDNPDGDVQKHWHWEEQEQQTNSDTKQEEEEEAVLKSWEPRPLFLPVWAVNVDVEDPLKEEQKACS